MERVRSPRPRVVSLVHHLGVNLHQLFSFCYVICDRREGTAVVFLTSVAAALREPSSSLTMPVAFAEENICVSFFSWWR